MDAPATTTETETAEPTLEDAFSGFGDFVLAEEDRSRGGDATDDTDVAPAEPETPADAQPAPAAESETQAETKPEAPAADDAQPASDAAPVAPQSFSQMIAGLKDATPLQIDVLGAPRAFDAIKVVGNDGAYIAAADVPKVKNALEYAERTRTTNNQLYQQVQAFQRRGGMEGLANLTAERAAIDAAGTELLRLLDDPAILLELATNPAVTRPQIVDRVKFAADRARFEAVRAFPQLDAEATATQERETQSVRALEGAFAQIRQALPALTDEDMATAREHFLSIRGTLFRPATAEEATALGIAPGSTVLDGPKLHPYFQHVAALREQAAKTATATAAASKENAARVAATTPARTTPSRGPAKKAPAKANTKKDLSTMSYADIKRAAMSGRLFEAMDTDDE